MTFVRASQLFYQAMRSLSRHEEYLYGVVILGKYLPFDEQLCDSKSHVSACQLVQPFSSQILNYGLVEV